MPQTLRDQILASVPENGLPIGNMALVSLLREGRPSLSDQQYQSVRNDLIAEGLLGKGRGRGGSVFLIESEADNGISEDASDDSDEAFSLSTQEAEPLTGSKAALKRKTVRKPSGPAQVLSYRHNETRVNNPEVGMVHPDNDPDQPRTVWKYDPHLDPQLTFDSQRGAVEKLIDDALASSEPDAMRDALVELKRLQEPYLIWTGKAEGTSFAVDTVSLHVHERVDPATILANARKRLKGENAGEAWRQADLFAAPFENLPLRQALDFYHHEKGWSNRLIAGDSLLVMNSLLQKESMANKVQMIYIDPPYGIRYGSNFQPFTNKRDVKDGSDKDLTQEPEMIKAFRDTWELGIHSYLTYLRDRLLLARDLLHESGSVFVQISDENLHHVRELLDEVMGAKNFVSLITYVTTSGIPGNSLSRSGDFIIWYAKNKPDLKYNQLYRPKQLGDDGAAEYKWIRESHGATRPMSEDEKSGRQPLPEGARPFRYGPVTSSGAPTEPTPFFLNKREFNPSANNHWKIKTSGFERVRKAGLSIERKDSFSYYLFLDFFPVQPISNVWLDTKWGFDASEKTYVVQTNEKIVERCILMSTSPGDLVFDPTCGSGTTSFCAENWGRRWITCDTSRVAITLTKQRLMTASFDYYALRYPQEGLRGEFDYHTVPHISLGSIGDNRDIDKIYDDDQPKVDAALSSLNVELVSASTLVFTPSTGIRKGVPIALTKKATLDEWEVPFEWQKGWPASARKHFDAFHTARLQMHRKMDNAIASHAKQRTLYDRPKIDRSRLRITGPFSVEAVPAATVLSLDETVGPEEADVTIARSGETSRQTQWRDELIRTGIRAKGGAMLKFTDLEAIPGVRHLHASGTLDSGERVVVSFGPEHAALEQKQVERAIEDAQTLVPKPKFVVFCAFTFDPEAAKDIDETNWPGVTLLKAQMNTDLLTEDLKKARSSNQSFWLMGQPEVELKRVKEHWQVEVHGFDYFDPREGTLVSGGKSKIAMWSLDTDYDGRSLMPHQVFFPMAGTKDGWNRLKQTIRAELNEDLLKQFHGTVSLPFEPGDHHRIAVKIVDDRGIESLKIMNLE